MNKLRKSIKNPLKVKKIVDKQYGFWYSGRAYIPWGGAKNATNREIAGTTW